MFGLGEDRALESLQAFMSHGCPPPAGGSTRQTPTCELSAVMLPWSLSGSLLEQRTSGFQRRIEEGPYGIRTRVLRERDSSRAAAETR